MYCMYINESKASYGNDRNANNAPIRNYQIKINKEWIRFVILIHYVIYFHGGKKAESII